MIPVFSKRPRLLFRLKRLTLMGWLAVGSVCLAAEPPALAIVGANVLTMANPTPLLDRTVVVEDGRIVSIEPRSESRIPENAQIVEAEGAYLMPGLAEMHAHIPGAGSAQLQDVLTLYVSQGITTIRGMLGQPSHLKLREQAQRNEIFAPSIITSGPSFNGNSVNSPEQAVDMVRAQKAAGYDFLKLHPGLSRAEFDAIVQTANELDMPFAGHVSSEVGLSRALEAKQDSIDHLDDFVRALVPAGTPILEQAPAFFGINMATHADLSAIPALAKKTAKSGVWIVPTETLMVNLAGPEPADSIAARPEYRYIPQATVAQWQRSKRDFVAQSEPEARAAFLEVRQRMLKALHDAGARIVLGSDAPQVFNVPGFSIHAELALMVDAGLTPFEALRTGTVNVATYFGMSDAGEVRPGNRADMVLLKDNPLTDISHTRQVAGVVLRGTWHGADTLQTKLDDIKSRNTR